MAGYGLLLVIVLPSPFAGAQERQKPLIVEAARPLGDAHRIGRDKNEEVFVPAGRNNEPAAPIDFGGFLLFPSIDFQQSYTDDLYASDTHKKADWVTQITPSLYVIKPFGRHQADFSLEGDIRRHLKQKEEDLMNVRATMGVQFEARHDLHFPIALHYEIGHEERDQNFTGIISKKPLRYINEGISAGVSYKPNRLGINFLGRYAALSFDNGVALNGARIERDRSDRHKYSGELEISYELGANHKPFVTLSADKTRYDNDRRLDSTDLGAMAGWEFAYKGLIKARIAGGAAQRNYDDRSVKNIHSLQGLASLGWNIGRYATLSLDYKRSLLEDNDVVAGALNDSVHLGFDYELTRHILLTSYVEQSWLDYENSARKDKIFGGGFGMRYIFSPYHSVSANYDHASRDSTSPGIEHNGDTYMIHYNMNF